MEYLIISKKIECILWYWLITSFSSYSHLLFKFLILSTWNVKSDQQRTRRSSWFDYLSSSAYVCQPHANGTCTCVWTTPALPWRPIPSLFLRATFVVHKGGSGRNQCWNPVRKRSRKWILATASHRHQHLSALRLHPSSHPWAVRRRPLPWQHPHHRLLLPSPLGEVWAHCSVHWHGHLLQWLAAKCQLDLNPRWCVCSWAFVLVGFCACGLSCLWAFVLVFMNGCVNCHLC